MHFFNKILEPFLPWLNRHPPPPPPPPAAQNHRPFAIPDQVVREAAHQNVPRDLDWTMLLIAFCLTSAVDIALQSIQTTSNLPPCFHILSFSILLAFVSLFMAKFINPNSRMLSEALEKIGIFFAATAFFLAVTTAFPPWLKIISWAIYALSLLAIIICKLCNRH